MDRVLESSVDQPRQADSPLESTAGTRRRMKQAAVWLVGLLAAVFCVWRMAGFIPQPLDAPSTLRPVLYGLFSRFVKHYGGPQQAFSAWYTFCEIALLIPTVLVALNYLRRRDRSFGTHIPAWLCSRALLFASVAACFLLCRYPTLLEPEFNPDEGQFLASADKLFYDADFFRADDCLRGIP